MNRCMIPITAHVSNALVRYNMAFGKKILISDISNYYETPEEFVADIDEAIKTKTPYFGGKFITEKKGNEIQKPLKKEKQKPISMSLFDENEYAVEQKKKKRGRKRNAEKVNIVSEVVRL